MKLGSPKLGGQLIFVSNFDFSNYIISNYMYDFRRTDWFYFKNCRSLSSWRWDGLNRTWEGKWIFVIALRQMTAILHIQ